MKTVEKKGLQAMAKEAGLDLFSLPYTDARPERQQWLAQQPIRPPQVSLTLTLQRFGSAHCYRPVQPPCDWSSCTQAASRVMLSVAVETECNTPISGWLQSLREQ